MGVLISRFRKKQSTIEVLEKIEKDIEKLQRFRLKNQQQQKRFIGTLVLYSSVIYIISALIFFFYYFPDKWKERFLYSIPLLVFPMLIFGLKKLLHWYFVKRIAGNDMALSDLREQKKQILEGVMETETYKKAKEILEKFDPTRFKELEPQRPTISRTSPPGTELRQRNFVQRSPSGSQIRPGMTPGFPTSTPIRPQQGLMTGQATPFGPRPVGQGMQPRNILTTPQFNNGYGTPQGLPLPRPIVPRDRSTMDKLLEMLFGDGPRNRYALICENCHSHNGMALQEEFEYLEFRCCYCHHLNHARKKRPYAPRIQPPTPSRVTNQAEEEEESSEDEEGEEEGSTEESSGEQSGGTIGPRSEESMDTDTATAEGEDRVPATAADSKTKSTSDSLQPISDTVSRSS